MSQSETPVSDHYSIQSFCETHDLDHRFVQFGHRVRAPYDTLEMLRDGIDELHEYEQSFRIPDVLDVDTYGDMEIVETMLWACGAYPLRVTSKNRIWANPQYAHGVEHQPPAESRHEHVSRALLIPTISRNELAARFEITPKSMSNWLYANDYDFRQEQKLAKRQIGRSIRATVAYTDYGLMDVCHLLPAPTSTVKTWAQWAFEDEWAVPKFPANAKFLD